MILREIITSVLGAVTDFLKGRRAEKKKQEEENEVIKILKEQIDKGEERELALQKELSETQKQLNDLMRDLIRRKANGRN